MTSAGNADIVKALLSAGANTEVRNKDDFTPLLLTVFNGRIFTGRNDIAKLLIDAGANVNTLTSPYYCYYSVLHYAAWHGNMETVRLLLDNGAHDDDRTGDGNTPLALAAHGACNDVLDLLIRRGCNVNNADKSVLVALFVSLSHLCLVSTIPLPFCRCRSVVPCYCTVAILPFHSYHCRCA